MYANKIQICLFYIFQISKPERFDSGWNSGWNLLIFGLTSKPFCLGIRKENSCLPKVLNWKAQWIDAAQALRMTDAKADFYIF